jgi:hypothetical protein
VGVNGGYWSVTHGFSQAVWAFACHTLTSCMAHVPPTRALPLGGGRGCGKVRVPTENPEEPE